MLHNHIYKFHREGQCRVSMSTILKVFIHRIQMLARNLKGYLSFWIVHKLSYPLFLSSKVQNNVILIVCTFALIVLLCSEGEVFLPKVWLFIKFSHSSLLPGFKQFDHLISPLLDSLKIILNHSIFLDANSNIMFLWNHLKML